MFRITNELPFKTAHILNRHMLKTRNILIDTQTFVANNFFQNKNLTRLANFGGSTVHIFLTEITKNEILKNVRENLFAARDEISRFRKVIHNKGKILKHVTEWNQYLELPAFDLPQRFEQISESLEHFIAVGNVTMIPYEKADLKAIVHKYFNSEPPFNGVGKKYEFPDAIVLSAAEEWCKENRTQLYVLSDDQDMKSYDSQYLILIPKLQVLLDKIIKQYHFDEINWVSEIFRIQKDEISARLQSAFTEKILDELSFDLDLSYINVESFELGEFSVVDDNSMTGGYAFQFDYDVEFSMSVLYNDHSLATYDKEDDKWYFPEKRRRTVRLSTVQTAEISLEAYYDDGESPENANVNITIVGTSIPEEYDVIQHLDGYMYDV